MTREKAVEILREKYDENEFYFAEYDEYPEGISGEYQMSLMIALKALQELEQKRGRWIKYGYKWKCSECDGKINIDGTPEENGLYYCPNCGAEMVKGEEE